MTAYGPWAEALRHYVRTGPDEVLTAHAEHQGGELGRIVPEVRRSHRRLPRPARDRPGDRALPAVRSGHGAARRGDARGADGAHPRRPSLGGQGRWSGLVIYANTAFELGDRDAAALLYDKLEPVTGEIVWNGASTFGHARTYLGMLAAVMGRHELADEHFAASIDFQERAGIRLWAAYAHSRWAEALATRGETARAREQAERALGAARDGGYPEIERRATELLEGHATVARAT